MSDLKDACKFRSVAVGLPINSEAIEKFGFVLGVGSALVSEPRENLTGDPYFTDGLRSVLIVSHRPIPYSDFQFLNWEFPPKAKQYKDEWLQGKQ